MRARSTIFLSGLLTVAAAPSAWAQNLLLNPRFDAGFTSWNATSGTALAPTMDASGIAPGSTYEFGSKILIQSASAGAFARTTLVWYANANCLSLAGSASAAAVSTIGSWSDSTGSSVAPATAAFASVQTNVGSPTNTGSGTVWLLAVGAALGVIVLTRLARVTPL